MRYVVLGVALVLGSWFLVGVTSPTPDWALSVAAGSILVGLGLVVFGAVRSIPRWRNARALPLAVALLAAAVVVGLVGYFYLLTG